MKAIVLVGGEGTRLRPLTLSAPKQMLPIVEEPMIERVLGHLAGHGIDEAILSLGYLPDAFRSAYPGGTVAGVRLSYAVEPEPLDTAGAVRFAADFGRVAETFVVVNGDVLTDFDMSGLVDFHRSRGAEGTIHLTPVPDPSAFGVVPTDRRGRVTAFIEKPPREEAPTNLINAGTYVLEPSVLGRIPTGRRVSIERETFPAMVARGPALRPGRRRLLARHRDAGGLPPGPPRPGGGPRGRAPGARRPPGRRRLWTSGSPIVKGTVLGACYLGDGVEIAEGATVRLGAGRRLRGRAGRHGHRVGPAARGPGGHRRDRGRVGARSRLRRWAERCDVRPVSVLGSEAVVPSGTLVDGERVPAGSGSGAGDPCA